MNTTTAAQRIQTLSALSLALLISGTTNASYKSASAYDEQHLHEYESTAQAWSHCATGKNIHNLGSRQSISPCIGVNHAETRSPVPIRLAKPLSGSRYIRSGESIRYSF
ncbi:hypothetical protein [Stutzerimonas stutzeri]|uniref:hypothetical protein n=1 Tax=Stutzerimonas stutzeri TaxID=316 RepID=UPI00210D13F4|nr:hypothetical protein [Stutzerimonas stutzeri]MCQ4322490.1 hypothetical protein [Stutzerimonas stutzeri]